MAALLATDIVMDVMRAADPAEATEARRKLASMAVPSDGGTGFAAALSSSVPPVNTRAGPAGPEAFERFEAFVLQTFIESMLPEDSDAVYGGGLAGGMWKSMMAEQLAGQMARAGGIGIAERILSDYYMAGEDKRDLSGVPTQPAHEEAQERRLAAQALVHEIQRRVGDGLLQQAPLVSGRKAG